VPFLIVVRIGGFEALRDPGEPDPAVAGVGVRALLPDLDPAVVVRVLSRGGYDHAREREAELIASLLGLLVEAALTRPAPVTPAHPGRTGPGPATDAALASLTVLFGRDGP